MNRVRHVGHDPKVSSKATIRDFPFLLPRIVYDQPISAHRKSRRSGSYVRIEQQVSDPPRTSDDKYPHISDESSAFTAYSHIYILTCFVC